MTGQMTGPPLQLPFLQKSGGRATVLTSSWISGVCSLRIRPPEAETQSALKLCTRYIYCLVHLNFPACRNLLKFFADLNKY